ncbi:MAG: sugar ABC transporter substrate-binding protein [Sedimentisphaerales bacterium]|nr:sugar ABC transporter substrate-binding protein [Sedimentisphaerales bacterium]
MKSGWILFGRGLIGLLAVGLGLCGCAKTEHPGKPRIALVMKSLANEFFKTMEQGARDHQRDHAETYELIVNGIKNEQDVNRQIEIVQLMIAQDVDAIVIAPADSKALVPVCKQALDAGICVINIDNKLDDAVMADKGIRIPFVGPDNRQGARQAGDYLAARLQPGDPVAILEGIHTAMNSVQRRQGFQDAMEAAGMEVVAVQSGRWEMDVAQKVAASILTEHPGLKALLCANDNMACGAYNALKDAGKVGQVLIVGYDNISAVKQLLREGKILCTIDQHADRLAVFGIEYALEVLEKKTTPADRQTPVDLITADNLS